MESRLTNSAFLVAKEKVDEAIKLKMTSDAWTKSPLRKFEYACAQYDIKYKAVVDTGYQQHTRKYVSKTTGWDIRNMLASREAKAMYDPYASWDYVTCTLSSDELKRVASWLDAQEL